MLVAVSSLVAMLITELQPAILGLQDMLTTALVLVSSVGGANWHASRQDLHHPNGGVRNQICEERA